MHHATLRARGSACGVIGDELIVHRYSRFAAAPLFKVAFCDLAASARLNNEQSFVVSTSR